LKNWQLEVDKLLGIEIDGQESLIHFEIETYYDSEMPERLLRYNVLARSELKRPVLSCVVHLLNDGKMKPPPLHWTEPIEGDVLKFRNYSGPFEKPVYKRLQCCNIITLIVNI